MRPPSFTYDNLPTLRLNLTADDNTIAGHRWLFRIPFNGLEYDDRPGEDLLAFNLAGWSFEAPANVRLLSVSPWRTTFPEDGEVRDTVLAGVDILLECASAATSTAFGTRPLLLFFDGKATDCGAVTLPTVTATTGTPWTFAKQDNDDYGVQITQLPLAYGVSNYRGLWNPVTNSPALTSGVGEPGDYYIVSTPGSHDLDGTTTWTVGDQVAFNGTVWQRIPAYGASNYKGVWNAAANLPHLTDGTGTPGDYYTVSVPGSTALDGNSSWVVGDKVAFNGTVWQRIPSYGASNYKGTWNPVTNTPALTGGTGTPGDYYIVSTPGTRSLDGTAAWIGGDTVAFNGTIWQRIPATGVPNYKGAWNPVSNSPALTSGVGTAGDYYTVSAAGTRTLDGNTDWIDGDTVAFNGTVWQRIPSYGASNYQGTWNPATNTPALASGTGTPGDYYIVANPGSRNIDGNSTWAGGDTIAFNGSVWQRIPATGVSNYKGAWNAAGNLPHLSNGIGTTGDYYIVFTAGNTTLDGTSPWAVGDLVTFNGTAWQRVPAGGPDNYKGLWDAATNTPELASATGSAGDYYIVSVAGTTALDSVTNWAAGNRAAFNGTAWQKVPGFGAPGSFAYRNDQESVIDLEGLTTTTGNAYNYMLSTDQIQNSIIRLKGKPRVPVNVYLPQDSRGTWRLINDTTGGQRINLYNQSGQGGARYVVARPNADDRVHQLFVANQYGRSISVLRPWNGEVLETWKIPTGLGGPLSLAFSPDGDTLYIGLNDGTIQRMNPDTGELLPDPLTAYRNVYDLLLDPVGILWAACAGRSRTDAEKAAGLAELEAEEPDENIVVPPDCRAKVFRYDLSGETVSATSLDLRDDHGLVDNNLGLLALRTDAGYSKIYLRGSGDGHALESVVRQGFVLNLDNTIHSHFDLPGSGDAGIEIDEDFLYMTRNGVVVHYYDLGTLADQGGLSVGNRAYSLAKHDDVLYCANLDDQTISRYRKVPNEAEDGFEFEELDRLPVPYGPGMLLPYVMDTHADGGTAADDELEGEVCLWVVLSRNNGLALLDAQTGAVQRLVSLGFLEPIPIKDDVAVATDSHTIWHIEKPSSAPAAPVSKERVPLLDIQDYFERGYTTTEQTTFTNWQVKGYTASTSNSVPFARVARTAGDTMDTFITDLIPVRRGAKLHYSIWLMRPADAEGLEGRFSLSVYQYDKNRRPAGTPSLVALIPPADGIWHEVAGDYALPLTHTPVDNSDGGPICYVRFRANINSYGTSIPDGETIQELQWSRLLVDYADTPRTQILYANETTVAATLEISGEEFDVTPGETAAAVQAAIRATSDENAAVIVTGSTNLSGGTYSGSYVFTWPPGITPAALNVVTPAGELWTTSRYDANSFVELSDTPNSFTGHGTEIVAVNPSGTTLEFVPRTFEALTDTPNDYTGHAGEFIAVNTDADGLEFKPLDLSVLDTLPTDFEGHAGEVLTVNAEEDALEFQPRVRGPESSTTNALAKFDDASGQVIRNSGVTLDDGVFTLPTATTPAAPAEGVAFYAKSDGKLYRRAADGEEEEIGTGASGGSADAESLRTIPIRDVPPLDGQFLVSNGTEWYPAEIITADDEVLVGYGQVITT